MSVAQGPVAYVNAHLLDPAIADPDESRAVPEDLFPACRGGRMHRHGKARKLYAFGCKLSLAATTNRAPRGQFVIHIEALHGATPATATPATK